MLIGRADDPQSPRRVVARRGRRSVWEGIAEPIWASGHVPHKQAGHTDALAHGSDIFSQDTLQRRGRPHTPYVRAAELRIAENHAAPLSALLQFGSLDGDGAMEMHMDWGHTGPDQREIRIATQCGHSLELLESGGKLVIDGAVVVEEKRAEYPMLYARFAELVQRGRSDVDLVPLQMTLDALALGRRMVLPRFDG